MDGLIRLWKRGECYLMGVATVHVDGSMPVSSTGSMELARKSVERAGKSVLCVLAEHSLEPIFDQECNPSDDAIDRRRWIALKDHVDVGSLPFRQAMAELAELPRLREEYDLIVLDLGSVNSQAVSRVGKLCDGIVLLCDRDVADAKTWNRTLHRASKSIRTYQREGMEFVGAWDIAHHVT